MANNRETALIRGDFRLQNRLHLRYLTNPKTMSIESNIEDNEDAAEKVENARDPPSHPASNRQTKETGFDCSVSVIAASTEVHFAPHWNFRNRSMDPSIFS